MNTSFLENLKLDFNGVFYRSEIDFPLQFSLLSVPHSPKRSSVITLEEVFDNSILSSQRLKNEPKLLENSIKLNSLYYILKYGFKDVSVITETSSEFSNTNIIRILATPCKPDYSSCILCIKLETVYS